MNEHRQYAFLRKQENEVLLIAVNFDETPAQVSINLPAHAFEYLNMPEYESITATNLLDSQKETISFTASKPVAITLPAYGGKILKIKIGK